MTPGKMATKAAGWLRDHLPSSVSITDITTQYAVIGLMGPQSRDILQQLTLTAVNENSFPADSAKVSCVTFISAT